MQIGYDYGGSTATKFNTWSTSPCVVTGGTCMPPTVAIETVFIQSRPHKDHDVTEQEKNIFY